MITASMGVISYLKQNRCLSMRSEHGEHGDEMDSDVIAHENDDHQS